MPAMRTLFVTDPPTEVEDWLERRRALGQDLYDEVWEGEYHVAPAPSNGHADIQAQLIRLLAPLADLAGLSVRGPCNIGRRGDYRVPDLAFLRRQLHPVWNPTATLVVEVVSPGDESRHKLDFYFRAGVEEMLIIDPDARGVEWLTRGATAFEPTDRSALLGITTADLTTRIDWPPAP
jgi:Uma2 family endonuclease